MIPVKDDALDRAREEIREADAEMARQFEKRMKAVAEIAEYKKERGMQVYDEAQEKLVTERGGALIADDAVRPYYAGFIRKVVDISKSYQHRLLEGASVAYNGIEGAFAHTAAGNMFPDARLSATESFAEAYEAVVSGKCDVAVLPIENSYAGDVGPVIDLIFSGDLYINGVYDLRITQNLLGLPGASVSDIDTVVSNSHALRQCAPYIKRYGLREEVATSTATAAKEVSERGEKNVAAIAGYETARLYGLAVLDYDIAESGENTTRFAVLSRNRDTRPAAGPEESAYMLMFSVKHEAGALAKAINVIGKYGFNMSALRSRPMKTLPWNYYFYVTIEGDVTSENGKKMLEELSGQCDMLKIAGRCDVIRTVDGGIPE